MELQAITEMNPFYLPLEGSKYKFMKTSTIGESFTNIYILCLRSILHNTEYLNVIFEQNTSLESLINNCANNLILVNTPLSVINNFKIREGLIEVNKSTLSIFNHAFLELNDNNLVYLMIESLVDDVKKLLKMYIDNDNLAVFIRQKSFYNFNKFNDKKIERKIQSLISKITDNSYWDNSSNYTLFDDTFEKRKFNIGNKNIIIKDDEITDTLLNFKPEKNYPFEVKTQKNNNQKQHKSSFFKVLKLDEVQYNDNDVFEILTELKMSNKEIVMFFSHMLMHKDYCHLIIKNHNIMNKYTFLFQQFLPLFRYTMSYTWLTFIKEEKILKTKLDKTSRCVFDLETASKLPSFYFNPLEPELNPYTTICVPKHMINASNNIMGVKHIENYLTGIVSINEFKYRLNLFTTGVTHLDLFDGIDWSHMVICGSVMAATLPLTNPLMLNPNFSCLNDFFDEYYKSSDIDIACNFTNIVDFVDHVVNMKSIVCKNLSKLKSGLKEDDFEIKPMKTLPMYINQTLLKQKCDNKEIPFEYDYIMKNLKSVDVIHYFYNLYIQQTVKYNKENTEILGARIKNPVYYSILKIVDMENVTLIINNYMNEENTTSIINSTRQISYSIMEEQTYFIKMYEILKFSILSKHMKHDIEIFSVKEPEFIKTVSRFHLPCVRSYYDGKTCYMTSSAISAYMTLTNIDIKYFVGKHNPVHIINKYRQRGYGTMLNTYEINQMIVYLKNNKNYETIYGLLDVNKINQIKGSLDVNNKLFNSSGKQIIFTSLPNYIENTKEMYCKKYPKCWSELFTTSIIDSYGDVIPIKKWIIESTYEMLKN